MREIGYKKYSVLVMLACASMLAYAEENPYLCELGIQGGAGYYVGDATQHIFMNVREAYGIHYRYKFTKRWAIQAKLSGQRITGYDTPWKYRTPADNTMWTNRLYNVDVMAECNFFRFGAKNKFDKTIKPYTPYIFLGVGASLYGDGTNPFGRAAAYVPFGIGFKWKFADWAGLNLAWQHNLYLADNLESVPKEKKLDNSYNLNGSNIMNFDLTGQLTLGLVVEFARAKKICRICNSD